MLIVNLLVGIVACLLMVSLYDSDRSAILNDLARRLATTCFVGTSITLVLSRFGNRMYRRSAPINWLLIGGSILACSVGGTLLLNACAVELGVLAPADFWSSFLVRSQFAAVLSLIFGVGVFGYRILSKDLEATALELRERELAHERASKLAVEAQLASLESHVRPHFLFNTLNTISSLIPEDPEHAESLIGKLATLLRLSLDSNQERVGSLERELKIVNDYLEIERARYGHRLRFQVNVPSELYRAELPALSLQTLVENSVKYAVAARIEGAEVRVRAQMQGRSITVEVIDDGPGFASTAIRPGHGLDNLQRRLAAIYGSAGKLETSQSGRFTVVSMRLPLSVREA